MTVDLAGFRAGEEAAIRQVYRAYGKAVRTVARSILRDEEQVADAVQLTFTKAWKASASFDPSHDLAPWLYAIARRSAIDIARKEQRPTAGGHGPEVDVAVTPLSFQRTWERYEIRRALDALPPGEAEVVRLNQFVGLSHPEIAQRLGVPVGTVKSRMNRAYQRLAVTLGHLASDSESPTTGHSADFGADREPKGRAERSGEIRSQP